MRDPHQDMGGINALKAQGLRRYTGITTTLARDYDAAAEAILRRAKPDFRGRLRARQPQGRGAAAARRAVIWAPPC